MTLRKFQEDDNVIRVVYIIEGFASLHLNQDRPERASRLIGWADFMRDKLGNPRPPVEQGDVNEIITACLEKMGEATFSDAYDEGKEMSLEVAVAYAL